MSGRIFLAAGLCLGIAGVALLQPQKLDLQQLKQIAEPLFVKRPALIDPGTLAPKLDRIMTSTVAVAPSENRSANSTTLTRALEALSADEYPAARQLRDELPKTSLEYKTLSWTMAYFAGKYYPAADTALALALPGNWPGASTMRANLERALGTENLTPAQIIAAFQGKPPETFAGALLLANAHKILGKMELAAAALTPFWRDEMLSEAEEKTVIDSFGAAIPAAVHQARMQKMLYSSRVASAARVAGLAGAPDLFNAWAAVIRKDKAALKLLDAVPESQRLAGYQFAKARLLRRQGKITAAANVMAKAPREEAALIAPDIWWREQLIVVRELLDLKNYKLAYEVAANHAMGSPAKRGDAEFHAGWIALRFLNDAPKSVVHFRSLAEITDGPISQARAYYWLGRAYDAGATGDAKASYTRAAAFATTYYGQLGAAKIGLKTLNIATPAPTEAERKRFVGREWVQAAKLFIDAGHAWRATPLIDALADNLTSAGEISLLADMAAEAGQSKLALQVGKSSAYRGIEVGALTHPLGAIPEAVTLSSAGRALAYAVARQESEFHVGAKSNAGALGLLQLLPGTAKEVAGRAGLEYSLVRLTADAGYNATLGARYLSEQIDRFDGSYILTFIAYNAGPRRATEWVKRFGNPKGMPIDAVVDWVELIPFSETRSYVQRVMENYQVYKWRLNGSYDIVQDLRFGRT